MIPCELAILESYEALNLSELLDTNRIPSHECHPAATIAFRFAAAERYGYGRRTRSECREVEIDAVRLVSVEFTVFIQDVYVFLHALPVRFHVNAGIRRRAGRLVETAAANRHAVHADRAHPLTVMVTDDKVLERDILRSVHIDAITAGGQDRKILDRNILRGEDGHRMTPFAVCVFLLRVVVVRFVHLHRRIAFTSQYDI